ncbi:MAG: type II toxin-antitoxin system HicA family toxin [Acidobacteria bacterium]|nr:type II toxin-antitoxin system HicA family toxin [Acidobacteriota bacterium]
MGKTPVLKSREVISILESLGFAEVRQRGSHKQLRHPDDRPCPSCLIYGNSFNGEPIHSVWAHNQGSQWAVLITVYRPDPNRWIDWRRRRKQ